MNVVFGASGFAKEVESALYLSARYVDVRWSGIQYFVVKDFSHLESRMIHGVPVILESDFFNNRQDKYDNIYIGIGNPKTKESIVTMIESQDKKSILPRFIFPNFIHPSVQYDNRESRIKIVQGNIICAGCILTTDIELHDFVHINLDCTIGHDVAIGDYSTLAPGVHVSGNVAIGKRVYIGTGAVIREKIKICDDAVIGAGAVVVKDIMEPGIYIGVPAIRMK